MSSEILAVNNYPICETDPLLQRRDNGDLRLVDDRRQVGVDLADGEDASTGDTEV